VMMLSTGCPLFSISISQTHHPHQVKHKKKTLVSGRLSSVCTVCFLKRAQRKKRATDFSSRLRTRSTRPDDPGASPTGSRRSTASWGAQ
jgi:hypothetical protein